MLDKLANVFEKLAVPLGKVNAVAQGFGIIRIALSIDIIYTTLIKNLIQFDSWSDLLFFFFFSFSFPKLIKVI